MDRQHKSSSWPQIIDIFSIVFEAEIYLIELQARSIELYLNPNRIANIYVIVNDHDSICDKIDKSWWGINSHKVQIIPRSKYGVDVTLDGWSSQQYYKLCAAARAESDWSMCLDSKTWFVQKLEHDLLFDSAGRANFRPMPTMEVFKPAQTFLENYFNISMPGVIGPAGVPFMFHTTTAKNLIHHIEEKEPFLEFFSREVRAPSLVTEFMLYSAFIIYKYKSYAGLYSKSQHYTVTNLASFEVVEFDSVMTRMKDSLNLTASIQNRAYKHLSDQQMDTWCDFLLTKHIITDKEIAKIKLNTLKQFEL